MKPKEKGKGVGGDGDGGAPDTNQTFSSSHTSHSNNASPNMPFFKLDVKFELPIYNGDLDAEKLDNWMKQLEVYCRVQGINDDPSRIQLATLRMSGMVLLGGRERFSKIFEIMVKLFQFGMNSLKC